MVDEKLMKLLWWIISLDFYFLRYQIMAEQLNLENLEDYLTDENLWIEKEDHSIYPIDRDKIQVTVNNSTIFSTIEYIKRGDIEL